MRFHRTLGTTALALAVAGATVGAAWAQPGGYNNGPPPPPSSAYGAGPNSRAPAPDDYDNQPPDEGAYNVPPPPGYRPDDAGEDTSGQAREEDDRYAYQAERWAAQNCEAERAGSTAGGAIIGGILGALIGAGVGGHGGGVAAGALIGGSTGAVIGHSAAVNSPNCPPGYVMRAGAPAFYPGPVFGGEVVYAAPGWYDPWIWYGGHWIYRPYPYHRYYWHRRHYH
ncbi:MAG: hypothetical protein JO127_09035 [Caulobacteraceae bacterium]|nr:hypothetical protein [Caulobacteraceae bacterium]